jgi:hypothetical protein
MTYLTSSFRNVLSLSIVCFVIPACGGKSEFQGGTSTAHTGGSFSATARTAIGGAGGTSGLSSTLASGGTTATASLTAPNGGKSNAQSTAQGGTAATGGTYYFPSATTKATGGTKATGSTQATGGIKATGGTQSVGGSQAAGGKSAIGGVTSTGSNTSAAGATGTGVAQVGGTTAFGGSVGTGGTHATTTSWLDAGATLNEFCTGEDAKVAFGNDEFLAPATSYHSSLVMDCCQAYGINLHTKPRLDIDIAIETIWGGASPPTSSFVVGESDRPMRAVVRRSTDGFSDITARADGTGYLFTPFSFSNPFDLGLCLQVQPTETPISAMLIYVPRVTLASMSSRSRFQIYLLRDSTITTTQAQAQPLDALTLADNPILDLDKITYLSRSSHEVGFNPGQAIGNTLKTELGSALAIPFVVRADSERIFLGTFVSPISSASYDIPSIMTDSIQKDTMTFRISTGNDPLADTRITTVLTALSRIVP